MTLVWAIGDNPHNHLNLGRQLSRLMGAHCTCRAGKRTNAWCAHITMAVMVLCAPEAYHAPTKFAARLADARLPDMHQPTMSGPHPVDAVLPHQAVNPVPLPPRTSRNTRLHTRDELWEGFGNPQPAQAANFRAGYAPHLAVPTQPQPVVRPGDVGQRHRRQRQRQAAHPSTLGLIENLGEGDMTIN